jgi:hypothetical protein
VSYSYSLDAECIDESAKAIRVEFEDGTRTWIPKSVIDDDSEVYAMGTNGSLVVKDWFAEKEGLE